MAVDVGGHQRLAGITGSGSGWRNSRYQIARPRSTTNSAEEQEQDGTTLRRRRLRLPVGAVGRAGAVGRFGAAGGVRRRRLTGGTQSSVTSFGAGCRQGRGWRRRGRRSTRPRPICAADVRRVDRERLAVPAAPRRPCRRWPRRGARARCSRRAPAGPSASGVSCVDRPARVAGLATAPSRSPTRRARSRPAPCSCRPAPGTARPSPSGTKATALRSGSTAFSVCAGRQVRAPRQEQGVRVGTLDREGLESGSMASCGPSCCERDLAEPVVGGLEHRVHVGHLAVAGDLDDLLVVGGRRVELPSAGRPGRGRGAASSILLAGLDDRGVLGDRVVVAPLAR